MKKSPQRQPCSPTAVRPGSRVRAACATAGGQGARGPKSIQVISRYNFLFGISFQRPNKHQLMLYHTYLFLYYRADCGSREELAFVFRRRRRFLFLLMDVDALFLRGDADSPDMVADSLTHHTPAHRRGAATARAATACKDGEQQMRSQ